jgi:hypothetical protein
MLSSYDSAMRYCILACLIMASLLGSTAAYRMQPADRAVIRNGQHDFDFEIGTWTIAMKRLAHPLTSDETWLTPQGYVHVVQKVWGGRASLAQLERGTSPPQYFGLMLRTYDPQTGQWSIYWAPISNGKVDPPLVGRFTNGRGVFFGDSTFASKPVRVRIIYSNITRASFRATQAFSLDGGATWQTNLIQTFHRVSS